jgi:hypothetical protein
MSVITIEPAQNRRFKISDPRPAYCSACGTGAVQGLTFYYLDADFDAGTFVTKDDLSFVAGSDELHLCEVCVRSLGELSAFAPQAENDLRAEIVRLRTQIEFLEGSLKRLARELDRQVNANLTPRKS